MCVVMLFANIQKSSVGPKMHSQILFIYLFKKRFKSKKKTDEADIHVGDVLITGGVSEFQSRANPYLQMHKISQGPEKL